MAKLSAENLAEVKALVATGDKIDAIKRVQEATDLDLKAAKALVNAVKREIRQMTPGPVATPSARKGCLGWC